MDQSSISSFIEPSKVDQTNSTVVEIQDLSMDADNFHSVEELEMAITFDVTTVSEETSLDNNTQYNSQIESITENDKSITQTANSFDVSASMDCSAAPLEDTSHDKTSTTIIEECDDSFDVNASMDCSAAPLEDATHDKTNPTIIEECDENFFFKGNLLELGRYMWETNSDKQCYTKGCLWSPDGTCCLVPVHLDGMHLVELPSNLYRDKPTPNRAITKLSSAVHVKEGGTVYDCSWYPFMNSAYPETCCWLASRQHEPIQMWDAFNGDLRASYRGYDDVDEIEAAISVIFSPNGEQVLGGYKKCIRIFDTDIPGRSCTKLVTKQAISCFALASDNTDIITTGSWNGVISLFDKRMPNMGSLHSLCDHNGGITFLKYSRDAKMLFSGARKDNGLCLWDMRDFSKPMAVLNRSVSTNQRIYFDLSPQNEWLLSGDSDGLIRIWNLKNIENERSFRIHGDSCNGVSFHPSRPIIASSAGQYHFIDQTDDKSTEGRVVDYENSLIFWWIEPRNR